MARVRKLLLRVRPMSARGCWLDSLRLSLQLRASREYAIDDGRESSSKSESPHPGHSERGWGREASSTSRCLMGFVRFQRVTRWGIGAVLLLLFQGLVMPRSAWAGCNRPVSSRADRMLDLKKLDSLITGNSYATHSDEATRDPMTQPGPTRPSSCSGPGCSSRVPGPAPVSTPDLDRIDQWGVLARVGITQIRSPLRQRIDEGDARPRVRKPAIFHPPPA